MGKSAPAGVMDPARVLVVGVNYAPEHFGNAPCTTGLAEYLAGRGHDVTVLTAMPYHLAWHAACAQARPEPDMTELPEDVGHI